MLGKAYCVNGLLGVPHQAERDDEYRGVKIKKDTIILACEW